MLLAPLVALQLSGNGLPLALQAFLLAAQLGWVCCPLPTAMGCILALQRLQLHPQPVPLGQERRGARLAPELLQRFPGGGFLPCQLIPARAEGGKIYRFILTDGALLLVDPGWCGLGLGLEVPALLLVGRLGLLHRQATQGIRQRGERRVRRQDILV